MADSNNGSNPLKRKEIPRRRSKGMEKETPYNRAKNTRRKRNIAPLVILEDSYKTRIQELEKENEKMKETITFLEECNDKLTDENIQIQESQMEEIDALKKKHKEDLKKKEEIYNEVMKENLNRSKQLHEEKLQKSLRNMMTLLEKQGTEKNTEIQEKDEHIRDIIENYRKTVCELNEEYLELLKKTGKEKEEHLTKIALQEEEIKALKEKSYYFDHLIATSALKVLKGK